MISPFSSLIPSVNSAIAMEREALQAQLALVNERIEAERLANRAPLIAALITLIAEEQIKKSEVFPKKEPSDSVKSPSKYRNPISGEEWSGRGNAPKWIKGKDKTAFLIPVQVIGPEYAELQQAIDSNPASSELTQSLTPASAETPDSVIPLASLTANDSSHVSDVDVPVIELAHSTPPPPPVILPVAVPPSVIAPNWANTDQIAQAS